MIIAVASLISEEASDQKRKATPGEAAEKGASIIVMGRPITIANNPDDALDKILKEIEGEK